MKQIVLSLFALFCSITVSAQVLKGKIVSVGGEPISNATVYVHEITSGIVADEQGRFQIKLKTGTYTCETRSIGFESQTKSVEVKSDGADIQITLAVKPLRLNEVIVTPSKENPAYQVMRHAIARAPFHLYQVSGFTSENYLKGSAKIEKIPGLMKMMIKDNKLLSLIGKLMVLESQNEITYQSPSKYTQKVIAYKSSIPKEMEPKGGIRIPTSSIYAPFFMDEISPLSPQAFRYYQFKLEDIFTSRNYQVNKIKVIPKVKSGKLFSGYVYILENNWSVYSVELNENEMGTTTRTKIDYQEVKPSVFMPITYDIYTNIGTMGVKGYGRFYSSVKYKTIKVNESANLARAQKTKEKIIQPVSKKQQKVLEKIDELSVKDKISTRDALKLARLTTSAIEPKELKEQKESIEIKDVELVKMEIDSMATKRDSTFWEDVRNVPLRTEEAESLSKKDTSQVSKDLTTTGNSIEIRLGDSNKGANLVRGGNIGLGKSARLSFDGLLKGTLKEYNFADGLWLGQTMSLNVNTTKTNRLIISPSAYYTTARKSVVWNVNSMYQYAPFSNGQLRLAVGNITEDIQNGKGTSRFLNSVSSLFFGDNVIRFYQNKYLFAENQIDISNGLRLTAGAAYENRKLLSSQTSYHFFGSSPRQNYPNQAYSDAFPDNYATAAWFKLEYTPFYRYRISDGKKVYVSSPYPTFTADYKKAIDLLNKKEQASYDKINLSVRQSLKLSEFDKFYYNVSAGTFLTKKKLYAPDLNYFATTPLFITDKSFDNAFSLLDNYSNSHSRWLETHLNWTSDYLLLKRIGFLQSYLFNESLQLHLLWSEQNKAPYTEVGYSIGFNYLGRIGVFGGFDGSKYKNIGIKVSFPLFSPFVNR
jgi:hypothetical protein